MPCLLSELWTLEFQKLLIFEYSTDDSKTLVTVSAIYLSTPGRSYLIDLIHRLWTVREMLFVEIPKINADQWLVFTAILRHPFAQIRQQKVGLNPIEKLLVFLDIRHRKPHPYVQLSCT